MNGYVLAAIGSATAKYNKKKKNEEEEGNKIQLINSYINLMPLLSDLNIKT